MGKKSAKNTSQSSEAAPKLSFVARRSDVDPTLDSLFSSSLGPVTKPSRKSVNGISGHDNVREAFSRPPPNERISEPTSEEDEDGEEKHESADEDGVDDASGDSGDSGDGVQKPSGQPQKKRLSVEAEGRDESGPSKKRKRKHLDDDLEEQYLQRLAREEARETAKRNDKRDSKRQKTSDQPEPAEVEAEVQESEDSDRVDDAAPPPQHEILSGQSADVEKAARTVFLGNVSTTAITSKSAYKTLLAHLSSHLSSLASRTPPYKVESLRFRSTPFANALPKRAAFAKQELMDATTKSTNAYAVYKTKEGARDAAKHLNGTVVLDRHLRVDEVAHPAKTDNRRCVFVGNLGFVDDGSNMQEAEDEEGEKKRKRKQKEPGDVEEGLWREFGKAGTVESVRVIRDPKTRVGKGIAYVQFTDENAVEAALLFNDKKFPPMLPRKLRVVRAKSTKRNAAKHPRPPASSRPRQNGVYQPKVSSEQQSLQGRAGKLFGKAGAANAHHGSHRPNRSMKPPEAFVFEGQRASSGQKLTLKMKKGKAGKPQTRSSRRGAAWKAGGAKQKAK